MMECYPGIETTDVFDRIRRCMEDRIPTTLENHFTFPNQAIGWFELSIQPVPEGVFILSIDVTARKRAELAAQRKLRQLKSLRQIDLAILGSTNVKVALEMVLDQVMAHLGVDAAGVLLLDPESGLLKYSVGRGFRSAAFERLTLDPVKGLPDSGAALQQEGFVFYDAVPLVANGGVAGVLQLFHRGPLAPDPDWLDFRDALAGQAAIAVENSRLFADLERAHEALSRAYDTTLEGWSRALDLRDRETEGHTLRVTGMTVELATRAGMSQENLVQVRRGALLHDIGKMGVPDAILLKPGPLTESEWAIMRQHPVFAYHLLHPIAYLREALDIPYCHHEKWDGTGYPRGVRGEEIPLAARLFAVVDVWDALRSDRPYRAGWPEDRVLDHLTREAGAHFDPEAIQLFLLVTGA